jgi:uncharacterized repeat protein (TIGR01451 family)
MNITPSCGRRVRAPVFKTILLFLIFVQANYLYAAPQCVGGTTSTLDWNTRDWPDSLNPTNSSGDFSSTLLHTETNVGGIDFTFDFGADFSDAIFQRSLENYADANGTSPDPITDTPLVVGPGGGQEGLSVIVNPTDLSGNAIDLDVILDVTLSQAVSALEVTLSDIDESGTRQDQVTVVGSYMGSIVYPVLSVNPVTTATFSIGGANNNIATANPGAGNRSPTLNPEDATLIVNFTQPVDSYQIIYADANEVAGSVGGLRGITMANEFQICPAFSLSGTVFEDADGDGVFSAGDTVISGATVELYDSSGTTLLDTVTTLADGSYGFVDNPPESYIVREVDPAGYVSVTDADGGVNTNEIAVTLTTADIIDRDFLDIPSANLSVSKDDSALTYTPGTNFSYTIVVANAGPAAANGATLVDTLPAWATGATWTCGSVTGGAVCPNASGAGSINETIATFPANSSVTFTISGIYSTDMSAY